jgi:hypothetical protein
MSKKSYKIFNIKLEDWIFVDPTFQKKTHQYTPISTALTGSKQFNNLSYLEKGLLIGLIEHSHRLMKANIKVDERLWKANGKDLERLLEKLQENQILNILINKEINEVIKKDQQQQKNESICFNNKQNSIDAFNSRFINSDFLEELKKLKLDFPLFKNNIGLLVERFKTKEELAAFVISTCEKDSYKKIKNQKKEPALVKADCDKYLTVALKSEMGLK